MNFIHRSSGVSKTFEWLPVVSFTAAVMATDLDFSGALTGAVDEETEVQISYYAMLRTPNFQSLILLCIEADFASNQ